MVLETGKCDVLGVDYEMGTQAALLSAIARSAEELTAGEGWPDGVNMLLESLGRATGVSRVWIFQTVKLSASSITQNYTFEWAAAPEYKQIGMAMFNMFTTSIDQPEYREMVQSRKQGGWQKVLTAQLSEGWLRSNLEKQQIKSMLTLPVMVEGAWWGTLGFDDCERDYDWSDAEIALLRTAGYLVSNAVLADRLSAKRKQFSILKEITDSHAWSYDFKSGQLWCSQELIHSVPMPTDGILLSLHEAMRLIHPHDRRPFIKAVRDYVAGKEPTLRQDVRIYSDCGEARWMELIGNLRKNSSGQPEQLAGIAVDIRVRKEEEARLQVEASTDPLTGVLNRREFDRLLQSHFDQAKRNNSTFALLLVDIDYFKGLNDKFGHTVGDNVLRYFTEICGSILRGHDIMARLGGDEFAILLPGVMLNTARNIGERIRRYVVSKPYSTEGRRVFMTASLGVALYSGNYDSPEALMQGADKALYAAKKAGRNCLVTTADPQYIESGH